MEKNIFYKKAELCQQHGLNASASLYLNLAPFLDSKGIDETKKAINATITHLQPIESWQRLFFLNALSLLS